MSETTVRLKTSGMHCNSCSMLVQMTVEDLPGVAAVKADYPTGITEVTYDPDVLDVAQIIDAVVQAGYGAEVAA
jgi:copper chaperone